MQIDRRLSYCLVALVILLMLNLHCWQPGVGSSRQSRDGSYSTGIEVDWYLGWPAFFEAELWQSDNAELFHHVLKAVPFYWPYFEMTLAQRYFGWLPLAYDAVFAVLALALVFTAAGRGRMGTRSRIAIGAMSALILAMFFGALTVAKHL